MTDGFWGLVGMVAVGYLAYRFVNRSRSERPRLGVLQGGRHEDGQFSTTNKGPQPGYNGSFPQIAVLSWPGAGTCKC